MQKNQSINVPGYSEQFQDDARRLIHKTLEERAEAGLESLIHGRYKKRVLALFEEALEHI